ncbi:MAG: winged helix-turn-helix domain-containing protein [Candidatus Bathyarchaeia archaeon]
MRLKDSIGACSTAPQPRTRASNENKTFLSTVPASDTCTIMLYRHRIRIVLDILSAVKEGHENGVGITHVMRKANVSYARLIEIIGELVKVGLIEEVSGEKRYRITPSGVMLLSEWEKFEKFTESFGLNL